MTYLVQAEQWLSAFHPAAPWVLLTVAIWLSQYLVRRYLPRAWEWIGTFGGRASGDTALGMLALRLWQGLPSVLAGALIGAYAEGGSYRGAFFGALAGAAAPVKHHLLKWAPFLSYVGGTFPAASSAPVKPEPKPPVLPLLSLLLAAVVASPLMLLPGCTPAQSASDARVSTEAALAFNGAVVALEVLDTLEAQHIDSIANPTEQQLKTARAVVERLTFARDLLLVVRNWIEGQDADGKAALADAVKALRVIVEAMQGQGVQIPDSVTRGLQLAALFAGVA